MSDIVFDRELPPAYGEAVAVAAGVRRVTARNPGPFTFHGTNSYIVGSGTVAIVDPGPDDDAHIAALAAATAGARVSHIFVTHTHRDHSGAAARLKAATGAVTVGGGRHRPARPLYAGEVNTLDTAADTAFAPDIVPGDREAVGGDGWRLSAVATPGHTTNHLCYGLAGSDLLFSGDHVMAWSTSIVAPPDGSMAEYMGSLDRLLARPERRYLPGHGGPVADAHTCVAALKRHRLAREAAILARLRAGDRTIGRIVAAVYGDIDHALHGAAALSVLAHLEDLAVRRQVLSEGPPRLAGTFRLA